MTDTRENKRRGVGDSPLRPVRQSQTPAPSSASKVILACRCDPRIKVSLIRCVGAVGGEETLMVDREVWGD